MIPFTVGTDQEFFLTHNGELVSAIPLLTGTKHNPESLPSGGTVQRDNVAMEFACPPAQGEDNFVETLRTSLSEALERVPENHVPAIVPSAIFPSDQLEHPEALEFGCDPDFDAWSVSVNAPPCATNSQFRSCGGHLHVGYIEGQPGHFMKEFEGILNSVKAFDIFLGIPFSILDSSPEGAARRELYGKAGCHRVTDYGFEYRTLSNFWLKSPLLVRLAHRLASIALSLVENNLIAELLETIGEETIQQVINEGDTEKAKAIFGETIMKHLDKKTKMLYNKCLKSTFGDIRTEWKI